MSTHNIGFYGEISTVITKYPLYLFYYKQCGLVVHDTRKTISINLFKTKSPFLYKIQEIFKLSIYQ